jgi:hypothetical protein
MQGQLKGTRKKITLQGKGCEVVFKKEMIIFSLYLHCVGQHTYLKMKYFVFPYIYICRPRNYKCPTSSCQVIFKFA